MAHWGEGPGTVAGGNDHTLYVPKTWFVRQQSSRAEPSVAAAAAVPTPSIVCTSSRHNVVPIIACVSHSNGPRIVSPEE